VKAETEGAIGGPANQVAPPLFADAASGDYRPAAGSPTIDAGAVGDGLGPLYLAGRPRVLGSAPDIGAYEFVPPPPEAAGVLTSLAISPKSFRARKRGGAIVSSARRRRAKVGATVRYSLSAVSAVVFTVERALKGRRVGGKCRKRTRSNRRRKRCTRFVVVRPRTGSFAHRGAAASNAFRFSGRLRYDRLTPRTKPLLPGRYRLVGRAGSSVKRAAFRIVK
jgi:hypothetical protein